MSGTLVVAARLVALKKKATWVSVVLQPMTFFSVEDPPELGAAPFFTNLRFLGTPFFKLLFCAIKAYVGRWSAPLQKFSRELELPEVNNPLFEGQFSPVLNLALFSGTYAKKQADWTTSSQLCGFTFWEEDFSPNTALNAFLNSGEPPVVFTLGSAAVYVGQKFFEVSFEIAQKLAKDKGIRSVLVAGPYCKSLLLKAPEGVFVCEYASYSKLFPYAAAVVHQGGIGTTAQALRAGKPALIVPFAHDQPDNARRCCALGVALRQNIENYTFNTCYQQIIEILGSAKMRAAVQAIALQINKEQGALCAAKLLSKCAKSFTQTAL